MYWLTGGKPVNKPLSTQFHKKLAASRFSPQRMKVYNLSCDHHHRFEGWFSSEDDFIAQSAASAIACPVCGRHAVERMPSAPRLNLSSSRAEPTDPQAAIQAIQAKVLELVRRVVASTEDVGERFAEEARRIHYNETKERAIRGVATLHEYEALTEEGIDVMPLPVSTVAKEKLQ